MARARGRPRTFEDADAFIATAQAISDLGYPRLTLTAVASRIGCGAQTLIDRFGSKQGLLLAYLSWTITQAEIRFAEMKQQSGSQLSALRAHLTAPPDIRLDETANPSAHANFHAFLVESRSDPDLRLLMDQRRTLFEREIIAALNHALRTGEIIPCDTAQIGRILHVAITGSALLWIPERGSSAREEIGRIFDETIDLVRPAPPKA